MAQKVSVILTDDIDGTEADETINFSLDGQAFEIDLSSKNAAALRKSLEKYTAAGRRAGRSSAPARASRGSKGRDYDIAALRAWANSNNIDVPARGRIPQAIVDQFKAAMPPS